MTAPEVSKLDPRAGSEEQGWTVSALGVVWRMVLTSSVSTDDLIGYGFPDADNSVGVSGWELPADAAGYLAAVTDVYMTPMDPAAPWDRTERPPIVVNGVTYSGDVYYRSRAYRVSVGADQGPRRDAWTRLLHYADTQHLTRGWETAWAPLSTAAARKVSDALTPAAEMVLSDADAVRGYWSRHLAGRRMSSLSEAQRSVDAANVYGSAAAVFGAELSAVALADGSGLLDPASLR